MAKKISYEEFLKRAREVWSDLYDYMEMDFKSASEPIKVICSKPDHQPIYPTPDGHLKSGCRLCANEQLGGKYTDKYFKLFPERKNIEGWLYYLEFKYSGQIFYKVGITKNYTKTRHAMLNVIEELEWRIFGENNTTLFEAFQSEQEIERDHGDKSRQELLIDSEEVRRCRAGPSECFFESLSNTDFKKYFGQCHLSGHQ